MSQEAEARLEQSFDRQDLLGEAMQIAYGPQAAALLMVCGEALRTAAGLANAMNFLEKGISPAIMDFQYTDDDGQWLHDPRAFDAATKVIAQIVEAFRPIGDVPQQAADAKFKWEDIPDYAAAPVLQSVRYGGNDARWVTVRRNLGALIAHARRNAAATK